MGVGSAFGFDVLNLSNGGLQQAFAINAKPALITVQAGSSRTLGCGKVLRIEIFGTGLRVAGAVLRKLLWFGSVLQLNHFVGPLLARAARGSATWSSRCPEIHSLGHRCEPLIVGLARFALAQLVPIARIHECRSE